MAEQSVVFDRAVPFYDQTRGFPPGIETQAASMFVQAGGLASNSRVIEIGIGTGRIAIPLAGHIGMVAGIDLSTGMMGRLREKQNGAPIVLTQGDATRLPYADRTFDAAVAVHVFHLIPNWQDALRELARVLKPNGLLLSGWNERLRELPHIIEAFNEVVPQNRDAVGVRIQDNEQAILEQGWTRSGEKVSVTFQQETTPNQQIHMAKNRIWSRLWSVDDETLAGGIAAMQRVIAEHYPDADQVFTYDAHFHVQAYQPPQT